MKNTKIWTETLNRMNRREALGLLGAVGAGLGLGAGCGSTTSAAGGDAGPAAPDANLPGCVLTPEATEGPFFVEEKLERSDLTAGETAAGITTGYPLTLTLTMMAINGQSCQPLSHAYVDIWHADVNGLYSDEPSNFIQMTDTRGQKYLRGYQVTGDSGTITFKTIYPGWYATRTIHIHVKVRLYSPAGDKTLEANTQVYFTDAMNDSVLALPAYASRGSRSIPLNTRDQVYNGTGPGSGIDNVGLALGQIPPGDLSRVITTAFDAGAGSTAGLTVGVKLS